jgi:hypothetical protein
LILKDETYFQQQYYIKKNILALRGSFRPVTKVNMDMYEKSLKMFLDENKVEKETLVVLKLPIKLTSDGEIDERDFMDRAELLCCWDKQ